MSVKKKINVRTARRALRTRSRIARRSDLPRVSVFRSLKNIYAQIIDDATQKTVASCSSLEIKDSAGDKKAIAKTIGKELAKKALDAGIKTVVFDRGSYLYHGRIQALADGLREGGLKV